jgi:hypothetical protein
MQRLFVITMLLALVSVTTADAAVITILNNDGVGEGFNDITPADPVGGNPGLTVGEQRLNVFQHAASIWGALLPSSVTIIVRAQFNPQTCTATQAVLGSAGPANVWRDFLGAPLEETWYHVALANKLSGVDLNPAPNLNDHDINATFNSNLNGDPACLGGRTWYYGYDGNEGVNLELLPVVLHELGHGLGFSTLVNSTGAEAGGYQDLYETFIRDNTLGLTWNDMTQAQRAASAINTNNVVWNGACVTARSAEVLVSPPTLFVNSGGPLPPKMVIGSAGFGPQTYDVTGDLVLVTDGVAPVNDGCEAYTNGPAIAGNIALIDRGLCAFTAKAVAAQAAGAIAVVIANNVAGAVPPGLGGTDPSITIPVVSVTQGDGTLLKTALLGGPVNITLAPDASQPLAGTDGFFRVKLYAPNPYQGGSSISHFDVSALPHLLMEPAINTSLSSDVDLTLPHFHDLGWTNTCELPVSVAISMFDARATNDGVEIRAKFYSTLGNASYVVVYRADGDSDYFTGIASVSAPGNGEFLFVDATALPGESYRYKIGVIDDDGEFFSPTADVTLPSARIELSQNTPNPFNPSTTIRFSLPASQRVGLAVYAANGALVRMLVDEDRPRGTHDVTWDGRDSAGNPVGSGVYFYRLIAGKFTDSRKMVLLK